MDEHNLILYSIAIAFSFMILWGIGEYRYTKKVNSSKDNIEDKHKEVFFEKIKLRYYLNLIFVILLVFSLIYLLRINYIETLAYLKERDMHVIVLAIGPFILFAVLSGRLFNVFIYLMKYELFPKVLFYSSLAIVIILDAYYLNGVVERFKGTEVFIYTLDNVLIFITTMTFFTILPIYFGYINADILTNQKRLLNAVLGPILGGMHRMKRPYSGDIQENYEDIMRKFGRLGIYANILSFGAAVVITYFILVIISDFVIVFKG